MTIDDHKQLIKTIILEKLRLPGIRSVSIVGSFVDKNDISIISDIDTIVICEELTSDLFRQCLTVCQSMTGEQLGFPGKTVFINSTFGPLKFDTPDVIVIHLMVYDVKGHIRHVNSSPFTCYDWERSPYYSGSSLSEIYPVLKLQYSDFFDARRGISNYLKDIESGFISYREYSFSNNCVEEITKRVFLNERSRGEYAYHIIKNLVCNYCKMLVGENRIFEGEERLELWQRFLPQTAKFIPFFEELEQFKNKVSNDIPQDILPTVRMFIKGFEAEISNELSARFARLDFMRHQRTDLNDGSFLGQKRDPSIVSEAISFDCDGHAKIYSSPLLRALETTKVLGFEEESINVSKKISEIDYGDAEGMSYSQLKDRYPDLIEAWSRGEDPPFPGGESTTDVVQRVLSFVANLDRAKGTLVVTHNVIIRTIVGLVLGIKKREWFKIDVAHVDVFCLLMSDTILLTNLSAEQRKKIRDRITS